MSASLRSSRRTERLLAGMADETFDFVIVGAGSAGCVLADRLSADGKSRVLVLEYGGSDRSIFIQMPGALVHPAQQAALQLGLCRRARAEPRQPPHQHAARQGARRLLGDQRPGLCPRQRRSTSTAGKRRARAAGPIATSFPISAGRRHRAEGGDEYRGSSGPLHTRYGKLRNPLYRAFIERRAGRIPRDRRRQRVPAGGLRPHRHDRPHGRRWSAADAYLSPAMRRPNVDVEHPCAGYARRLRRAGAPPASPIVRDGERAHRARQRAR